VAQADLVLHVLPRGGVEARDLLRLAAVALDDADAGEALLAAVADLGDRFLDGFAPLVELGVKSFMPSPMSSRGRIIVAASGAFSVKRSAMETGHHDDRAAVYMTPGPRNMRMFSTSLVTRETTSPERDLLWKEKGSDVSLSKSSCFSSFST
jgi:hypothetical protein